MNKAVCVLVGGALGSLARYSIQGWVLNKAGSLPLGTVFVNVTGAFLMGLVMTAFHDRFEAVPEWRLFIAAGILGGFTTFSGLAWDAYQLYLQNPARCAGYLIGSFAGGGAALFAGLALGRVL